jgi:hypothetical protein
MRNVVFEDGTAQVCAEEREVESSEFALLMLGVAQICAALEGR